MFHSHEGREPGPGFSEYPTRFDNNSLPDGKGVQFQRRVDPITIARLNCPENPRKRTTNSVEDVIYLYKETRKY